MKLQIKKKYFDEIKAGLKRIEFRDAHITFVCEETGEQIKRDIWDVGLIPHDNLPSKLRYSDMFEDDTIIFFDLE